MDDLARVISEGKEDAFLGDLFTSYLVDIMLVSHRC